MNYASYFFVTGATGGIGSELCRMLPTIGLTPIIGFHKNEKQAHILAAECGGFAVKIDLGDDQSIENAIERIAAIVGNTRSLAGVVLGASPAPDLMSFTSITSEILYQQLRVNAIGSQILLNGLIKKFFRKNKAGTIIGILTKALGSNQRHPSTGMGAYIISKGALKCLLAVCSAENLWLKIRTINPGFTETKMLEVFDTRYLELAKTQSPFSSPQEVAKLIIKEIIS